VVPMLSQDLEIRDIPYWGYFCQISDSTTSYGSYSGAVPNEKIGVPGRKWLSGFFSIGSMQKPLERP